MPAKDGRALVRLRAQGLPLPTPKLGGRLLEQRSCVTDLARLNTRPGPLDAIEVALLPGNYPLFLSLVSGSIGFLFPCSREFQIVFRFDRFLVRDLALLFSILSGQCCAQQPHARAHNAAQQDHQHRAGGNNPLAVSSHELAHPVGGRGR